MVHGCTDCEPHNASCCRGHVRTDGRMEYRYIDREIERERERERERGGKEKE